MRAARRGRYSSTKMLSSTSSSAPRCASVTDPPARKASRPPWIAYRHETASSESASSAGPKDEEARAAEQGEAAAVVRPAGAHAPVSYPVDRLPVRDPEPAGTGFGALDDRPRGEHALRRLEPSGVEHSLS